MIPAAERVKKARALIQKAREIPAPPSSGFVDFSYAAEVKAVLQQARDLIKFIPYTPSASPELKDEVAALFQEIDQAEKEILHR
jgi:hypothetical protein